MYLPIPDGERASWRVACSGQLTSVYAEGCRGESTLCAAMQCSCNSEHGVLKDRNVRPALLAAACAGVGRERSAAHTYHNHHRCVHCRKRWKAVPASAKKRRLGCTATAPTAPPPRKRVCRPVAMSNSSAAPPAATSAVASSSQKRPLRRPAPRPSAACRGSAL